MKEEILTTKLLPQEIVEKNNHVFQIVMEYSKISEIIDRTHLAMGKKVTYKVSTSSTLIKKFNPNVYASTH